jgi:hypothetical protein
LSPSIFGTNWETRHERVAVRARPRDGIQGKAPRRPHIIDLPARIRRDLVGATTCTHLNSSLRTLADAQSLSQLL